MELDTHAPGVYIGLSHKAYIADPSLGYSAIKALKNPVEFWERSQWNPLRPAETDDQKRGFFIGTAFHALLLEGLDVYEEAYGIVPTKDDFPDHLDTIKELQGALRDRAQSYSGLTKPELVDKLHRISPDVPILDLEARKFQETCKRPISRRDDSILRRLHGMAMAAPESIKLLHGEVTTLREAFTGGLSEVSVFWRDENDIPMRARFDKLKPNSTIDLKTISKWDENKDFRVSLLKEIKHRGYWLQVAHYHEARLKLREFVANGQVYGPATPSELSYLETVAESDEWMWAWVFAKTAGAPRLKAIPASHENTRFTKARQDREEAIGNFIMYREMFGLEYGVPWIDTDAIWDPDEDEWSQAEFG